MGYKSFRSLYFHAFPMILLLLLLLTHRASINHDVMCYSLLCVNVSMNLHDCVRPAVRVRICKCASVCVVVCSRANRNSIFGWYIRRGWIDSKRHTDTNICVACKYTTYTNNIYLLFYSVPFGIYFLPFRRKIDNFECVAHNAEWKLVQSIQTTYASQPNVHW